MCCFFRRTKSSTARPRMCLRMHRPVPVSEYGRQKARTEAVLCDHMARGAPVAILRLAKVVSPGMELFRGWIEALSSDKPIRAFHDMTLAPTPMDIAVAAISNLMRHQVPGIFQLTGPYDVSYFDVGRYLAQRLGANRSWSSPSVPDPSACLLERLPDIRRSIPSTCATVTRWHRPIHGLSLIGSSMSEIQATSDDSVLITQSLSPARYFGGLICCR